MATVIETTASFAPRFASHVEALSLSDGVPDADQLPEFQVFDLRARSSSVAIVIPVWNQGETLILQLASMQRAGIEGDIILADSSSSDGSTEQPRLRELGVRTLLVTRELGLGTALRMGIAFALCQGYEGVITIDGNGKDDVTAIPRVRELLEEGVDFVQASRFLPGAVHDRTPWDRLLGIRMIVVPAMRLATGFAYTDPTNGFKGLSRRFLLDGRVRPFRNVFEQFNFQFYLNYRVVRLGYRVTEIPASRVYPEDGTNPTKIKGLWGRLRILGEFLLTILGCYNPPPVSALQCPRDGLPLRGPIGQRHFVRDSGKYKLDAQASESAQVIHSLARRACTAQQSGAVQRR